MADIHSILQANWGYSAFRPLQEDIITSVLNGNDTLAIMPTGGGKSICFQVPALAKDGICLVVTPLIALMKDQVQKLKEKGILALAIHSGMPFPEVKKTLENALHGNYKFLYVSPERLQTNFFKEYLPALPLNLIAVDEAHCISQWGYDFRPAYLTIADIRKEKPGVPVLALTATATAIVQKDICDKLEFKHQQVFKLSYERPNLSYSVLNVEVKINKLLEIVQKVGGCGIVYCRNRKRTKEVAALLQLHNISADYYHAGLTHEQRNEKQDKWLNDTTRIMVCTNAFGMGIDKPDVRLVVHVDIPECLESYYQEAGRAGRDGKKSYAVLLYHEKDINELQKLPEIKFPSLAEIKKVYQSLVNYLQLPSGSGEDMYFDFSMQEFVAAFKLAPLTALYALKALEQDGLLTYNEQVFLPSTVVFTCSKTSLQEFEENYPAAEQYIKILLRSYGGIFDAPVPINEKELARMLKVEVSTFKKALLKLEQKNIISYQPQKDKPQVQFLYKRPGAENLSIDLQHYHERKNALILQVTSIINYVKDTAVCHAKIIANYFGDITAKDCGICDNCLSKKRKENITKKEFSQLELQIISTLQKSPATVKELIQQLSINEEQKLWKIIDHLVGENIISMGEDNSGKLYIKKMGQDKNPARF
ncbi:MAG: RecQ family ATP-dependent DNA helicase [Chitinophagaceae bacterium]|nr:RecQ family ATP-dependent DNA helicase [Chitinophagaceae bacterium]